MAVKEKTQGQSGGAAKITFSGRHLVIGANVAVMIALAVALVVFVQWIAFKYVDAKKDMTTSGVNSLTPSTEKLFRGLNQKVWLTSLYFKTDLEDKDQPKYRSAVADLFSLLQRTNRSKVEVEFINPLQDADKREKLFARIKDLKKYKDEAKEHKAFVETFANDVSGQIGKVCGEYEQQVSTLVKSDPAFSSNPQAAQVGQQLSMIFRQFGRQVEEVKQSVHEIQTQELPQYTNAINAIKDLYNDFGEQVEALIKFADGGSKTLEGLGGETKKLFASFKGQLKPLADRLKADKEKADKLESLKLEEVLRNLRSETRNQIVVETENEAKVISFNDTWPASNPDEMMAGEGDFSKHRFAGESVVASAVLGLTNENKAAVIFTRFGGSNPFFGGFPGMQQQQQGPTYRTLKEELEAANFTVHDWDVSTSKEVPSITPAPSRKVFLVMRPEGPPPPNPMMPRPPQQKQFDDASRDAVLSAIGENGRAIFLAGWQKPMGPMGMPSFGNYDYADYLKDKWGLEVLQQNVIMSAFSFEPGKWGFQRNGAFNLTDYEKLKGHVITDSIGSLPGSFVEAVPVKHLAKIPDGVTLENLVSVSQSDDIWGEANIQGLIEEMNRQGWTQKKADDISGPFPVAVAGTKGEGKVVVVGSEEFANDRTANARGFAMGANGQLLIRAANPANTAFLVSCCQWLSDNTEFMGIGRPVEVSRLTVAKGGALSFWHAFAWGIWPAVALVLGGGVWFSRRR